MRPLPLFLLFAVCVPFAAPFQVSRVSQHLAASHNDVVAPAESMQTTVSRLNRPGQPVSVKSLSISVDGRKSPEQIPDRLAYRHFVAAVVVRAGATLSEIHRRDALLSQIGLSSADYERFVTATRFVRDDLDNIENERKLARNKGQAAIVATALRLRRDAILENAVDNMLASLEPVGRTAFYTFIQVHVKPRIVIYDLPSAASHH